MNTVLCFGGGFLGLFLLSYQIFTFLTEMLVFTNWMAVGKRAGAGEGRGKGITSLYF